MTAYYCVWVDSEAWLNKRMSESDNEAEETLGTALKRVCSLPPETQENVGVLHHTGEGTILPVMLEGLQPRVMRWSPCALTLESDPEVDHEFARELAPNTSQLSNILLISVDADVVERVDAFSLGAAVYKLLDNPHIHSENDGIMTVLRGASFPANQDCYLIFYQGVAQDPNRLLASEEAQVRRALAPQKPATVSPDSGRLQPIAVHFSGPSIAEDNATVTLGRGHTAVLFGRNGAGKTAILTAIERMLQMPFRPNSAPVGKQHLPAASVILQATDQRFASQQFALLLAHLAFQPLSDLSTELRGTPHLPIRAWDAFQPYDQRGGAISVADLVGQPIAVLQDTVTAMLTNRLSRAASDIEPLARYIATSPYVIVAPGGRVMLAADPSMADSSVLEAAERLLQGDFQSGMSGQVYRVYLLAETLVRRGASAVMPTVGVQLAQCAEGVAIHRDSGWLDAGEKLEHHLRHDLPIPLAFAPGRQGLVDLNETAERAVIDLLTAICGAPEGEEHIFASWDKLSKRVLELFQQEVTRLLPRFIGDSGHLTLGVTSPALWHRRRIEGIFTRDQTEGATSLDALPSGYAIWLLATMTFARERLLRASWSGRGLLGDFVTSLDDQRVQVGRANMTRRAAFEQASPASVSVETRENRLLYLLDEPEVHLHLTAQHDVVQTVGLLSDDAAGAVVATHALPFVDAPFGSAIVHTLVNRGDEISMSQGAGLRYLTDRADELGIAPSALAQLYRGVLLLEGINDVEVVNRYGGIDLDRERVLVIPMQGHSGTTNLAEAEFLHTLGIPLYVMLDHVRRSKLLEAIDKRKRGMLHGEESTLLTLHDSLVAARLSVRVLPFAGIDIITVVPDNDIYSLLKARGVSSFDGWKHILAVAEIAWRKDKRKFKQTFFTETGVDVDSLLKDLRASDHRGRSPQLHRILSAMLTDLTSPQDPHAVGINVLKCGKV